MTVLFYPGRDYGTVGATMASLSDDAIIANLLAWYAMATDTQRAAGADWYPNANRHAAAISAESGVPVETVAAVIAALSPQNRWNRNLVDAAAMCALHAAGINPRRAVVCTYNANRDKAAALLAGADWRNGLKTSSFVDNLSNPYTSREVTVDLWHVRACLSQPQRDGSHCSVTPTQYRRLAHCTRLAAARLGILPSTLQATVWVVIRGTGE